MIFSKKDYTTNVEAMYIGLAEVAQGLAAIVSLGYFRPSWALAACLRILNHKHGPIEGMR